MSTFRIEYQSGLEFQIQQQPYIWKKNNNNSAHPCSIHCWITLKVKQNCILIWGNLTCSYLWTLLLSIFQIKIVLISFDLSWSETPFPDALIDPIICPFLKRLSTVQSPYQFAERSRKWTLEMRMVSQGSLLPVQLYAYSGGLQSLHSPSYSSLALSCITYSTIGSTSLMVYCRSLMVSLCTIYEQIQQILKENLNHIFQTNL